MKIRDILNLLYEGRIEKIEIGDALPFRVYVNPTARQMEQILSGGEARAIIDTAGDFYVWDAYRATHDQVAEEMLISMKMGLVLRSHECFISIGFGSPSKNANFMRAFKNNPPRGSEILDESQKQTFKAWYNGETGDSLVFGRGTHIDVLMNQRKRFNHDETWDIVTAMKTARVSGWVRLAVETSGSNIVAYVQADTTKQGMKALRWMRKEEHSEWDILRFQTFSPDDFIEIEGGEQIDRFIRYGRK